jgi:hypothetical protein
MRKIENSLLLLVTILLCGLPSYAQSFRVDPMGPDGKGGYFTTWDIVQQRLILYRDTTDATGPAALIFSNSGAIVPVFPLHDLSNSRYVDVWNAAATPDGGIVLAAIVGYTTRNVQPGQLKSFLLTYSAEGKLVRVWNTDPYHHHLVAVDHEGSVFAMGDANLAEPYPLLIKYNKDGKILREFLPSNLFPEGHKALLASPSANGEPQMVVSGQELCLWLPVPQEVLHFSLDGHLINRTSLAHTLAGLADERGSDRATVKSLTCPSNEEVVAQVQLWPKDEHNTVQTAIARIKLKDLKASVLPVPLDPVWLVGNTRQGRLVFLQPERDGKAASVVTW